MKPLIVGEAPSKNEITERPIEGRVGLRLANCAGLTMEEFLAHFDRVNLLHVRQDTKEKGFEFDQHEAERQAARLSIKPGQTVLLLGRRVAKAFSFDASYELFVRYSMRDAEFYIMPHPSGINRWWNDDQNIIEAVRFMHNVVERTRHV